MDVYLDHHRAFCENLARLNMLSVSWDGGGGLPLRRKALQSAVELFGRRPDLAIGSMSELKKGGVKIGLVRDGCDISVLICPLGTISISRHRPKNKPDIEYFAKHVEQRLLDILSEAVPAFSGPRLDLWREEDHLFSEPFEGFELLRLHRCGEGRGRTILIGRRSYSDGVFAFHDARDLPVDIYRDQILCGTTRLSDLINAYHRERDRDPEPV